jgi:hypothetical protein
MNSASENTDNENTTTNEGVTPKQADILSAITGQDATEIQGLSTGTSHSNSDQADKFASETQKETLDAIKKGERIALIIAAIVAVGTIGQWITTCQNNVSTSVQTDKLIMAANTQAGAAKQLAAASQRNADAAEKFSAAAERNAAAAESFFKSAVHINSGLKDAVGELKSQVETSRQQFATSERPYVNVVGSKYVKGPEPEDHRVYIDLWFVNYGRSPALHVIGTGRIFYGADAMTQADIFFSEIQITHGGRRTWEGGSSLILPPFLPSDIEKLPRTTLFTQEPLGPEDTALMHTRLGQIVAVDHVEYKDRAGNTYQTDFCAESLPSGAITTCPTHNEMR